MEKKLLKTIEKNVFLDILEISDVEFQKKAWFGYYVNYCSSYTEIMCGLFDDNQFDLFIKEDVLKLNYSVSFCDKLRVLQTKLKLFNGDDNKKDIEIIYDVDWIEISQLAKSIINEWPCLAEIINETY